MVCKKCGKEFEGAFCPYCGERNAIELPPECPVCSTPRKDQERFCSNCGYSYYGVNLARLKREEMAKNAKTNAQNAVTFVKKHRTPFIAAAVLLVLVLIVVIPTTVWAANIFRTGKVDQISIGMSQKEVIDKLGMPYDYSPNSSGFSYYSDNYLKLKEKLDSLDLEDIESFEELEDAIINEEKYREELENTVYDYIYIGFDGDGLVDSVFFDNEKCDKDTDVKKKVKDSELITESVVRYQETPVYYRVEYTDGSLYKGLAKNVTAMSDSYTLEWTDRYGNDFQDRVETTPNSEIAAMGECGEDAIYAVDMEGVMTISGSGTVTSSDFNTDMHLERLIIEEGITAIGGEAFSDFGMAEVVIPDSVTSIGYNAFKGCSNLTSVVIPDSVTSIGARIFFDCEKLKNITIPFVGEKADGSGVTRLGYLFGDRTNYNHENDYYRYVPDSLRTVIVTGGTIIGDDAFQSCNELTSITLPDSVTSIGESAFAGCYGLTSITIPEGVTGIGASAFSGCSALTDVYYQGDLSGWLGIEFRDTVTDWTLVGYEANPMCEAENLYINGELLQGELVIPEGTQKIGDYAFYGCSGLTSIVIPDSVTSIGEEAFNGCDGLTSITIPFVGAKADGTGAKYFGYIFGASSYSYNDDNVPESLKEVIVTGGTIIEDYAFKGCGNLTSITIPDSVTSIGYDAFVGCGGLTSITIPFVGEKADGTGSTSFDYIFTYDVPESLKEVIITGGESIADGAFEGLASLTTVTIPDTVTTLGDGVFAGCESLITVTIPGTVTALGDKVFEGCTSLEKIIFNGTIEQWEALESSSSGNDKLVVECIDGRYRFFVTYDLDGGVNAASNPSSYTVLTLGGADGSIALADPNKVLFDHASNEDGTIETTQNVYTFLGWYKDALFEQEVTALTLDLGDVTLYAKWSEQPNEVQTEVQKYVRVDENNEVDAQGEYILFGEYPKTIKADDVTVGDVADDDGYYLGSDGERYAKVVADPLGSYYNFSDGSDVTNGETYYFKVEPIRWRILSESDGSAFILADGIIANKAYDNDSNNYKNSDIRAWLNGEFLNTAFGDVAQGLIETTEVDNSAYSTGDSSNEDACENTFDKVFLLSWREVINSDYGFSNDTARQMTVSDYARSTGAYKDAGCGYWWLRSPSHFGDSRRYAVIVDSDGNAGSNKVSHVVAVYYDSPGVVPALNITL